ncbi:MAG: polysaccharide biosynthesis/export family protein [Acidobacteria bacterium]|nr:polysaccharide biosynthesis/export family protein [Acidobacteriota bacterium]
MRKTAMAVVFVPLLALQAQTSEADLRSAYVLGPEDQISVWALDVEEIQQKVIPIGASGYINVPLAGRIRAAGLKPEQLEAAIAARLKTYVKEPQVTVNIAEFRSQPVSVIGAVNKPGVHQLRGRKTLVEILSLAEGLRNDAGHSIKISRQLAWGRIPLASATDDPSGQFSVAQVNVKAVMEARAPEENILIRPNDVISVPRAELVYVIGEVRKSGGFALQEREHMSVLQALSLAEGLNRTAGPQNAKILRTAAGGAKRTEVPVDVREILAGNAADVALEPEDILFVPNNAAKSAALRGLEAAIQLGTGVVIWRR